MMCFLEWSVTVRYFHIRLKCVSKDNVSFDSELQRGMHISNVYLSPQ